jgi:hypothetical protein
MMATTGRRTTARGKTTRLHRVAIGGTLACIVASLLLTAPAAFAEETETHVFDATLSLTGNCETSKFDPVADPSCPEETPEGAFNEPYGVTTDAYGDIYYYGAPTQGEPTVVYVFNSSGRFLTEIPLDEAPSTSREMAVDAEGDLYIHTRDENSLFVLTPSKYDPEAGEIVYGNPPVVVAAASSSHLGPITVDQSTGRVFTRAGEAIVEFGSHTEGNALLRTFGALPNRNVGHIAIDAKAGRIYMSESLPVEPSPPYRAAVTVVNMEGAVVETITGAQTAEGLHEFGAYQGELGVAVDESTGHLFVADFRNEAKTAVYEFNTSGETVSVIRHSFQETNSATPILVDNGIHSPNSAMNPDGQLAKEENPNGSFLFVPSGVEGTGHLYVFEPKRIPKSPVVADEAFSGVSETEALLTATVDPQGLSTRYGFEYIDASDYERNVEESGPGHGFDHALSAGVGTIRSGNLPVPVSAAVGGLTAGVSYEFRVRAENTCAGEGAPECESEGNALAFATFPVLTLASGICPNQAQRPGASAMLPDCRAYELVTPADTNGHAPMAPTHNSAGPRFGTPPASSTGEAVAFLTLGGALPEYPGTGGFNGDAYVATRGSTGWQTASVGPTGALAVNPEPGGFSPDLGYLSFGTFSADSGSLDAGAKYIRSPGGAYQLVGEGSLATELSPTMDLISAGGTHTIFNTGGTGSKGVQLEPDAPPSGTAAIYDRTSDGVLHVVSLLPGNVTPDAGEGAHYDGASAQGNAVAFSVAGPLYVRLDDVRTLEVAAVGATFEGLSEDGRYLFYLLAGDLYRYDTESETSARITESSDVTVVNIPSDGTTAYFASPSVLGNPGQKNPNGAEPVTGEANLYYWDGSAIYFIATLRQRDMQGEIVGSTRDALDSWASNLEGGSNALDPSRTTSQGGAIIFESGADLTGYRSEGASEIYRYDVAEGTLACLSCVPTQAPPTGNATLETVSFTQFASPIGADSQIPNLSEDGRRVFFQSSDALVPADTDGVQDVYEWEANGEGSCATAGGCIFLISSGHSAHDNYLYGVSESGRDVFIDTSDLLTPEDGDETSSIYDARVEGGFPSQVAQAAECLGEACQPGPTVLNDPTPASFTFEGAGNLVPPPAGKAKTTAKAKLTGAQKLAAALKVCEKKRKSQRKRCEVQARKRYGHKAKNSTRARRASSHGRTVR